MSRANPLSVFRARKAFENFTGHKADKSRVSKLDDRPVAGYRMGDLLGVAYEATRDGKKERYFHEFKPAARPELVAKSDGSKLYIDGGNYRVTERGIEDNKKMPELFIVNPSRRRPRRKAKSAAPKKRKTTFMANPRRRRRRARKAVATFRRNPVRRLRAKRNPIRRRRRVGVARRGYRRNPIRGIGGKGNLNIMPQIPAAIGVGLGAVGVEWAMGYMGFLPAAMKTGPAKYVTKAVIGIALGWVVAKFANKKAGEALALGAIAISAHDAAKAALISVMPNAQFGQYMGGWSPYGYPSPTMNSYPGLGYYSPAPSMAGVGEYMQGMPADAFGPNL